jgi:hypothetical protein
MTSGPTLYFGMVVMPRHMPECPTSAACPTEPAHLGKFISDEMPKWRAVMQSVGAEID